MDATFHAVIALFQKREVRSRSESYDEIIRKINEYDAWGYKEVVLTGIHLGAYGLDLRVKEITF